MRLRTLSPIASSLSPGSLREPPLAWLVPVSLVSHSLPSPKSSSNPNPLTTDHSDFTDQTFLSHLRHLGYLR
jgi:hypothetical protein